MVGTPEGPAARLLGAAERRRPVDVLRLDLASIDVLVLCADAIAAIPTEAGIAHLRRIRSRVVFSAADWNEGPRLRLFAWYDADFQHVEPRKLWTFLFGDAVRAPRPQVSRSAWWPPDVRAGTPAAAVLEKIPLLTDLRVEASASASHQSLSALYRNCLAWYGMSPKRVLERYQVAVALEVRALGGSAERCAEAADFADDRSLRAALVRLGVRLPPRGVRRPASGVGN